MIRAIVAGSAGCAVLLCGASAGEFALSSQVAAHGFVRPVPGARISQGFGCTWFSAEPVDSACPGGHWHSGVDLAAARGTEVYASAAGLAHIVAAAGGFGLHVVVNHGGGLASLYGHLSSVAVFDGSYVSAGQLIGAVGSTGNSTGPHLHFEIDRNGIAQDPSQFVSLP